MTARQQHSRMDNLTAHNAVDYDLKVRDTIPFYETIHREVLRLVKVIHPEPSRWLDTGCGTGRLVGQALAAFPKTQFILADPAESMLAQARLRFAGTANERITILPATDSARLLSQIAPGTLEVVTAIQCHHYLREEARYKAVQACFELLKLGGIIVTFENVAPRTPEGTRFGMEGWKAFLLAHGRTAEEADKHLSRYGTEFFPLASEQHLQLLTKVGFRVVELFWYSQMQAGFYAVK